MSTPVNLGVRLGDLRLDNPVMTASGCAGSGQELSRYVGLAGLGAVVTRSVTRSGGAALPGRQLAETPSGLVYSTGAAGAGIDGFLATELPWLLRTQARVVVSVAAGSLEEYAELARRVGNTPGVAAIEVAPDMLPPVDSVAAVGRIAAVVRREAARGVPVVVKVTPGLAPLPALAAAVAGDGADAVTVAGTPPGVACDPHTLRSTLSGRLAGPAVFPVTLHAVSEVATAVPGLPVIAVGGVRSGRDAAALLAAGASAVQAGTVMFAEPDAASRILEELAAELSGRGLPRAADVIGCGRSGEE